MSTGLKFPIIIFLISLSIVSASVVWHIVDNDTEDIDNGDGLDNGQMEMTIQTVMIILMIMEIMVATLLLKPKKTCQ